MKQVAEATADTSDRLGVVHIPPGAAPFYVLVSKAQYCLGQAYSTGDGLARNLSEAEFWWTRAARCECVHSSRRSTDVYDFTVLVTRMEMPRHNTVSGSCFHPRTHAIQTTTCQLLNLCVMQNGIIARLKSFIRSWTRRASGTSVLLRTGTLVRWQRSG